MPISSKQFLVIIFLMLFAGNALAAPIVDVPLAGVDYDDPEVQFNLGHLYHKGLEVPQNYNEAVRWYTKSAKQGYAKAQSNLGVLYFNGQGVPQNYIKAYAWLSVAAAQGNEAALTNRNIVMKEMTAEQIAKGQELAAQLFEKYDRSQ